MKSENRAAVRFAVMIFSGVSGLVLGYAFASHFGPKVIDIMPWVTSFMSVGFAFAIRYRDSLGKMYEGFSYDEREARNVSLLVKSAKSKFFSILFWLYTFAIVSLAPFIFQKFGVDSPDWLIAMSVGAFFLMAFFCWLFWDLYEEVEESAVQLRRRLEEVQRRNAALSDLRHGQGPIMSRPDKLEFSGNIENHPPYLT